MILVGDFNAPLESAACNKIFAAGFKCAERESKSFIGAELPEGAWYSSENKGMARLIDHIFISSPNCVFERYTYCDQKIAYEGVEDYPSDHIPRIATCTIE